jgi:uncharacterized protein YbjT (DUF2867 family)
MDEVFVAGGTGYLGRPLLERLCQLGYSPKAVARSTSVTNVPSGSEAIVGDVLNGDSYAEHVPRGSTFVHLVGVAHPAPWKAAQFRAIDLVSFKQSVAAAKQAGTSHFVFVSVAHPAPAMKAYVQVRTECEAMLRESGLNATILQPWYVLGPGHRWPWLLVPLYRFLELLSATRSGALRLGLITRQEMLNALVHSIQSPAHGIRVLGVPEMRALSRSFQPSASPLAQH